MKKLPRYIDLIGLLAALTAVVSALLTGHQPNGLVWAGIAAAGFANMVVKDLIIENLS